MVGRRNSKRSRARRRPHRAGAKSPQRVKSAPRAQVTPRADRPPKKGARKPSNDSSLVVGLGASAGGLEAVRKLLAALPAETGFAFILIQHREPSHESMLAQLLARDTAMKVVHASDGMPLQRNCLYVIPPQADLAVREGALRFSEPQIRHSARMPIDFFLHSLGKEYGERAVAVILSGTGGDGSAGIKTVSENGGLVIAQDPNEAAFSGMPHSAIATGVVNLVLPTTKIPHAVITYAQHPYVVARSHVPPAEIADDAQLTRLIDLLRDHSGQDFASYKKATLFRRVLRRMATAGIKTIDHYLDVLRQDNRELELLVKDLYIHVTSFFRDSATFEALAKTVVAELVRRQQDDRPIRIWVAGCSSGEEAYSVAILFFEAFGAVKRDPKFQIFASDISPEAVAIGRNGVYREAIKAEVKEERLARFFTHETQGYRVTRELRDSIVFTVQDVLTDPPFAQLDLISCRNLLIYLQPSEQEKLLAMFHFALREGGFLFLGAAEAVGRFADGFEPVNGTRRAFRRIGPVRTRGTVPAPFTAERSRALWSRVASQAEPRQQSVGERTRALLLETFAPAAVLVNRQHQGLYFFGPVDRYLRVAAGEGGQDLPAMLRQGLANKFRTAARQAIRDNATATVGGAQVKRNGGTVPVSISVRPVQLDDEKLLLVTFADEPVETQIRITELPADASRVEQLESELDTARRELDATIRDLQSSNQELTSLNEESLSLNEEYQSTNEELEASREELQSLNEELTTLNAQLQEALDRANRLSDDLTNILNSSDTATLFLDKAFKIRLFTPRSAKLFNLIATDVGRPLADLASRFTGPSLLDDAHNVLTSLMPVTREVTAGSSTWYLRTVMPYRTRDDRIEGVVVSITDISSQKAAEQSARAAQIYAEGIVETISQPLVVLDKNSYVLSASASFYRFFGLTPEATVGRPLPDADAVPLGTPALHAFLDRIKSGDDSIRIFEAVLNVPPHGARIMTVTAKMIGYGGLQNILLVFDDITESKRVERELTVAGRAASQANLAKSHFLAAASHDLRQPLQTLKLLLGGLEQRIKDEQAQPVLARMGRVLETMAGMLTALLDIDRLEAGIQPTWSDFPVSELFDALSNEFPEQAKSKGLGWRVVPCGLAIRSDRHLLEDMVRNLISNAIRYTDKGRILLGCRRRGDRLRIEVWDTGIGISEEQLPRVFEEYHQAAEVDRQDGLGLGLAIVQRLGELLSHPLGARSWLGEGSVFSIEVPLAGAAPLTARPPESPQRAAAFRAGTILVIEDDAPVQQALSEMFKTEGHRVTAVAGGQAALDLVVKHRMRPDLVISDYNLPGGMNGLQTAAALRSALARQVPAVILSGETKAEKLRDIEASGCVGLTKPIKAAALSRLVQRLLARELPRTESPAIPEPAEAAAGTVFVVDDDGATRDAVKLLLSNAGFRVKTYASARTFLDSLSPADEGCLVTDVRMPGMNGLEMLARLAAVGSKLPAIVITGQGDIPMAVGAMQAGAVDFIEKPVEAATLLASLRRALRRAATPDERERTRSAAAMRIAGLTRREREIMNLVVDGQANKQIAERLSISQRTVEAHRAAVMKKLGVSSLSDLVRLALRARNAGGSGGRSSTTSRV